MRNILLLALLSMSLMARSQTTITVTIPQDVATREWVAQAVKARFDSLHSNKPSAPSFPRKPCKEGPELKSVTGATAESLSFKFHGNNVVELYWWITGSDPENPLRSGIIAPEASSIPITYSALPVGSYTLGVSGTKCIGSDTRIFSIKQSTHIK